MTLKGSEMSLYLALSMCGVMIYIGLWSGPSRPS